jgi:predicted AlkP superfamily pyrophosphatase or phosphodiesterase
LVRRGHSPGTPPIVHGIVGNGVVRLSTQESLFHLARRSGEKTDAGYDIIVTADHGMTSDGNHGGNTTSDRHVPLFISSSKVKPVIHDQIISQLQIAPLACYLPGIDPSEAMAPLIISGLVD